MTRFPRRSLLALIVIAPLLVAGSPATTAAAQTPPPAAAQGPTAQGIAKTSAYGLRLAPSIGGTALTMTFGGAGALLQNGSGTGIAAAADLGLLATVLQNGVCDAKFPFDFLPQPVLTTNAKGDAHGHSEIVPLGIGGVGVQDVVATVAPTVESKVTFAALDLQQAVRLGGLRAEARSSNPGGATPTGEALVQTDLTIPGVLDLRALRWEAAQRGAAEGGGTGSFTFASGSVLGIPLASGDVSAAEMAINSLLGPLGLKVTMPQLVREEGVNPIIRMTPLVIGFVGSPVLNTVLEPLLDVTRTLKEQLVTQLSANCFTSYGGLLADLLLGLVIGTGQLNILVGGVEVTTNDDVFTDPFGRDQPLPPDGALVPAAPSPGGSVSSPGLVVPAALDPASPAPPSSPVARAIGVVCETVHPNGSPGCSKGAGAAAGAVVLGSAAVAAVADLRIRRRRSASGS